MYTYKMSESDKAQATALLENMIAHGYHLMQYPTARAMVDYYNCFPLSWWQESHDRFMKAKKA